jgi:hypothetical protein
MSTSKRNPCGRGCTGSDPQTSSPLSSTRGRQGDGSNTLILKFFRKAKFSKLMRNSLRAARIFSSKPSSVRLGAWSTESQQLSYIHLGIGVTRMTFSLSSSHSSGSITRNSFCCLSLEASPRSPSTWNLLSLQRCIGTSPPSSVCSSRRRCRELESG